VPVGFCLGARRLGRARESRALTFDDYRDCFHILYLKGSTFGRLFRKNIVDLVDAVRKFPELTLCGELRKG
jgi:hypothetical protein